MDNSYYLVVSLGTHRVHVPVSNTSFFTWIEELKKEFQIYHSCDIKYPNDHMLECEYFILNYHGHLEKIGGYTLINDLEDLPFA